MIKHIINSRAGTITFAAGLIAFSVGVSAILGLLRDRLLVSYFDVSRLDVYFAAFSIPDFIYGIVITGGIVAAFLPVFASTREKDEKEGWKLANNTLNALFIVISFFCALLFVLAPLIVRVIVPGFPPEYVKETVLLTRIMLASPILLGISSLFSGVLQYFDRFLAYSLAPIFYNIGIIFGIVFFTPYLGLVGLAYGVIFGSLLHFLIQVLPARSSGFSYKPVLDFNQKELRRILYLVLPRVLGQISVKVNIIVITALASLLAAGSISVFNLANHLQSFPVRVIGVAFAVAAFPAFSRSLALKDKKRFLENFSMVIRQVLFLIIPVSVVTFLLRAHIVRLVLGVEGFEWWETRLTAASLGIFAFSFFASALVHILVRAFFSFQDTKTPVIASLISMGTSIGLFFFFIWTLGFDNFFRTFMVFALRLETIAEIEVIAFPLAILVASVLHLFLLLYFLRERVGNFYKMGIGGCLGRTLFSSFVMGASIFLTLRIAGNFLELDTFTAVFLHAFFALAIGAAVYLFSSRLLKAPELAGISRAFRK